MSKYDNRWQTVEVNVEAGIAWVTLNRPDKRNAMSPTLNREMLEVLDAVEFDDATDSAIIRADMGDCDPGIALPVLIRSLEGFESAGPPVDALVFGRPALTKTGK